MQKVRLDLQKMLFNPQDEDADVLENEGTNVKDFFGFDGLVYAAQQQKELLDRRIKVLESELVKFRELRRDLLP